MNLVDKGMLFMTDGQLNKVSGYLKNYDEVKERLIIRIQNFDQYRDELNLSVYKEFGDMILGLYFILEKTDTNLKIARITRNLLHYWKKDKKTVFQEVLENTMRWFPPVMFQSSIDLFNIKYSGVRYLEIPNLKIHKKQIPIFSTTELINGATSLFYPGVQAKIAEMMNGDYYVVFTSPHEVRIHDTDSWSVEMLVKNLNCSNAVFNPNEILTKNVYIYKTDTGILEVANNKEGKNDE